MALEDSTQLPWLSPREQSHPEQVSNGFPCGHAWLQERSQARTQLQATWENHDAGNILHNEVNWPEKRVCPFRRVPGSHPGMHVHSLCISCCLGISRNPLGSHSGNLAFVFPKCQHYCSSNRNKKETASLPGRVLCVAPAGILTFLTPTCLPPQPREKACLLGRTWTKYKTWIQRFHAILTRECFLWNSLVYWEHVYLFCRHTKHSCIWWHQEPFYLPLGEGKREMEL